MELAPTDREDREWNSLLHIARIASGTRSYTYREDREWNSLLHIASIM